MTSKYVISSRSDGFGARLVSMINALYVAEVTGLEFKFTWPDMRGDSEFHAVPPVEQMFSAEFIERYHLPHFDLPSFEHSHNEPITQEMLQRIEQDDAILGLNIKTCDAPSQVEGAPSGEDIFARLWPKIGFTPRLASVFEHAQSAVPAETIAVHCRRGDTVTGIYRYRLFNYKYFPTSFLKDVLADARDAGQRVLLFSDDAHIVEAMREQFGVLTTKELAGSSVSNRTEEAIFDFAAMSACRFIVCTHSVFAILASMVGGVPRKDPIDAYEDLLKRRHLSRIDAIPSELTDSFVRGMKASVILKDLEQNPGFYSPLERAKELQWAANEPLNKPSDQMSSKDSDQRDRLLAEAQVLDPENQTYSHLRALHFARRGMFDKAEALLEKVATQHFERTERSTSEIAHSFNILDGRIAAPFKLGAGAGSYPFLTAFYAYHVMVVGGQAKSLPHSKRAYELRPSSDLLLAVYTSGLVASQGHAEAKILLEEAFRSGRDAAALRDTMVSILEKEGDKLGAIVQARVACSLAPQNTYLRVRLAWFLVRVKQAPEASRIIAGVAPDQIENATGVYLLSKTYDRLRQPEVALAMAHRAVSMRPNKRNYRAWLETLQEKTAV